MIIVNYYQEDDYNPETDGYHLTLAGVINDVLDLNKDIQLIIESIENDPIFKPENGEMYEIHLNRATIASAYPIQEPAFAIDRVIKYSYNSEQGYHVPVVRL